MPHSIIVFDGENTPPKGAPAASYNIGNNVRVYRNENSQFTGRIRDRNYYSGRWVYNVDTAAVSEKFIVGLVYDSLLRAPPHPPRISQTQVYFQPVP